MMIKEELTEQFTESLVMEDKIADEVWTFFKDGGTFGMLQNISKEQIEQIYTVAYYQYDSGDYISAQKTFQMLCILDHFQGRFFLGLGACSQQLKQYQSAIESYQSAAVIDLEDPRPIFYLGECYLQIKDLSNAKQCFYLSAQLSKKIVKYNNIYKQSLEKQELLQSIKK